MGRCCSPCLGDLDPNAYRRQIEKVLALFDAPEGRPSSCSARSTAGSPRPPGSARYEGAAALLRRRERLADLLDRLSGVLRAVHADPRLVVARHPAKDRFDAFWIVGGRVADWGAAAGRPRREPSDAAAAALSAPAADPRAPVPADEVDEVRIASAWIAEHEPPALAIDGGIDRTKLAEFFMH